MILNDGGVGVDDDDVDDDDDDDDLERGRGEHVLLCLRTRRESVLSATLSATNLFSFPSSL